MPKGPWIDQDGYDNLVVIDKPLDTGGSPNRNVFPTEWLTLSIRGADIPNPGVGSGYGLQSRVARDLEVDDPMTSAPDGDGNYPDTWAGAVSGTPSGLPTDDPQVDGPAFVSGNLWDLASIVSAGPYAHPSRTTKWWEDGCRVEAQTLSLRFRVSVDQDPDINDWPDGAIGVEYEGPCIISDVNVIVDGVQGEDTADNQDNPDPDDASYFGGLGTVRLVPGASLDTPSYIIDALAAFPDVVEVDDIYGGPVETDPLDFDAPNADLTVIPNLYADPPPDIPGFLGDHYTYYFMFGKITFTVSATVVRPRYRWIFAGIPTRLIWPRESRRNYPPPNNPQSGSRFGSSSPF